MKRMKKPLLYVLAVVMLLSLALVGCDKTPDQPEHVDYATSIALDMNSTTAKIEATVHMFIDGDTTHFNVPNEIVSGGVLKARYIAINTPESTGKIEPWGNEAAQFTREKLEGADSIILESDTDTWNVDSTGERRVVWIWYRTKGETTYRNLNIEILQNGYALASNSAGNRYGQICMDAIAQAKKEKLVVYSNEKDPDFPYGDPTHIPLSVIRLNIEDYYYNNVYFEGTIVQDDGGTIYVEDYDEATGMYYGITAYYGTSGLPAQGLELIRVGNRVRLVGVVTYFEGGDIWQISDLYYDPWEPDDPRCLEFVSSGHTGAYPVTDVETFLGKKTITVDGQEVEYDYAALALNTSIAMNGLKVTDVYTTHNGGSNDGAMTLTCTVDGKTVTVRTTILKDADGKVVTADFFRDQTINVKGVIEEYDGKYQIKVFSLTDVTIVK